MRFRSILILIAFFVLSVNMALSANIDLPTLSHIELDLKISSELEIVTEPDYTIKYVKAKLIYYPITEYPHEPIEYEWDSPGKKEILYEDYISNSASFPKIGEKISFPIKVGDIPVEERKYIWNSTHIDSNDPEIIKTASEIAKGEDDLMVVLHKLAIWTNQNVEYDLSTLTKETSQKSSWVLKNRYGVCDEITNLFIGLCRSVGIPAKFVSGLSYSNSGQFDEEWNPHGWAEVYVPGHGWIPFDVTYGQYMYVDPAHIKMQESSDPKGQSIFFEWKARGVDVISNPLDFEVEIKRADNDLKDEFAVDARLLKEDIGEGSYNAVEVILKNPTSYYQPVAISVSNTQGLTFADEHRKELFLLPEESRKLFWVLSLDADIKKGYIYSFPIVVYSDRGQEVEISMTSERYSPVYSKDEIEDYIDAFEGRDISLEDSELMGNLELSCDVKDHYYTPPLITCNITNIGNLYQEARICLDDSCVERSVGISRTEVFSLSPNMDIGNYKKTIYVEGSGVSIAKDINISYLDSPKIEIMTGSPYSAVFGEDVIVNITLFRDSVSIPEDVSFSIERGRLKKSWAVENFSDRASYYIKISSFDISKDSTFKVVATHYDKDSNRYITQSDVKISLLDLTLPQKIVLLFRDMIRFLENSLLISSLIIGFLTFVLITMVILKN